IKTIIPDCSIPDVQVKAVYQVCDETAKKYKNKDWIIVEKCVCIKFLTNCKVSYRFAGFKSKAKAGAHHTGENGNYQTFFQGKLFYCFSSFFFT
ncbi:MAG: hypothetical protein H6Q40_302, partial [Deltaproteobacteria bacterium]|nr:hypothetical protein [Deltaproteobacteria bacterium]